MSSPGSGLLRVVRVALLTGTLLAVSLSLHVLAGGGAPRAGGVALLVAVTLPAVVLLTGRRLGPATLLPLLGGGQLLYHAVFQRMSGTVNPGAVNPGAAGHGVAGHGVAGAAAGALPAPGGPGHHGHGLLTSLETASDLAAAHAGHAVWPMLLAHAVATIVTASLLGGADRALWRLWLWLIAPLTRVPSPGCVVTRRSAPPAVAAAPPTSYGQPLGAPWRRGPPSLATF